ncbi:MAG TPA: hypothetical protein PLQ57_09065 [Saprospiraceae bacterium]|nr:hypothetical protein [Saprospiraceae bacterium]
MHTFLLILLGWAYPYPVLPNKGKTADDFIPKGYQVIQHVMGHLDADTITDAVLIIESIKGVQNLKETDHNQQPRILFILLGQKEGGYHLSVQSNESTMLSDDGGVFGDPLAELFIENKVVHVSYYGGSNFKWDYTYKWRLQQNDWYLIGATHSTMNPIDNVMETYDFNFNTGKAEYTKMPYLEEDDGKESVVSQVKKLKPGKKPLLKLKTFKFGSQRIYKNIYI